jgi:hypothetical protein
MYSPKINEQHIPTLYRLGKHVKKPMTRLVDEAIRQYLENHTATDKEMEAPCAQH